MLTPREETRKLVIDQLRDRLKLIDEGDAAWAGLHVVTRADLEAVEWEPLPPHTVHRAEILAPGRVAYTMVCPNCEQTTVIELVLTTTLEWGAKGKKLKPKVEGSAVAHMCHQVALPLDGQQELPVSSDEVSAIATQLDRLDDFDVPVRPTYQTIAGWDDQTREDVSAWAESVIRHRTEDAAILVPPMPEVLDTSWPANLEATLSLIASEFPVPLPDAERIATWTRDVRVIVATWASAVTQALKGDDLEVPDLPAVLGGESPNEALHRRIVALEGAWMAATPPDQEVIAGWPDDVYDEVDAHVTALEQKAARVKGVKVPSVRAAVFTAPEQLVAEPAAAI